MELLRRLYRRGASAGPSDAQDAVEALLRGGSVDEFLSFAARMAGGSTTGGSTSNAASADDPPEPSASPISREGDGGISEGGSGGGGSAPFVDALRAALYSEDPLRVRTVVKLFAKDTKDALPDDRNDELGMKSLEASTPFCRACCFPALS